MLDKSKIDRINFLAAKSKKGQLTYEEKIEQKNLRKEYILKFRENFRSQLDRIKFVEDMEENETPKHKKNRHDK